MLQPSYDTEAIKARVDLVDLAGRYTTLRKWSMREWAGPCPRGACTAKTDGFHVHDDGWFTCYSCREGKHGDAIEFVRWLGLETARRYRWDCIAASLRDVYRQAVGEAT